MRDQTTEYIEDRREPASQSQDNNRRAKSFSIAPAKDPDTETILGARMDVLTNSKLTDGARALFCLLLDLSLDRNCWHKRKGQVCISNTQLRERLCRSARAIYGWTKELEGEGHIWLSKLPRPNMQPMNVFHITDLLPRRDHGPELAGEGMYGNGYRQPARLMPQGARGGTCTKRHYLVDAFGAPLYVETPENGPAARTFCGSPPQNLRGTPAQNDTCPPQNLRETPAKLAGDPRTKRHLPPAQNDTTPPQEPAVFIETQKTVKEVGETSLSCLTAEEGATAVPIQQFSGSAALRKKAGERGFMVSLAEALAQYNPSQARKEMLNWGGLWVNRYRKNPEKAWRVLAELRSMVKEGRITSNAGAAADDLWRNRFA